MAVKNRPRSAKETLAKQTAGFRRGAPGKQFIGQTHEQSERAKQEQLERVQRMAEVDTATHDAERLQRAEPLTAILGEVVQDAVQLAKTLLSAPFRILAALREARRPREA